MNGIEEIFGDIGAVLIIFWIIIIIALIIILLKIWYKELNNEKARNPISFS